VVRRLPAGGFKFFTADLVLFLGVDDGAFDNFIFAVDVVFLDGVADLGFLPGFFFGFCFDGVAAALGARFDHFDFESL
jgi:hypothetical protein